ncbi:MetQ/NlpA family ABC transporter substrate-binding protein [Dolosigranulum savutiense]|uniref:MetQ/NlpA family ABC transporter substrate-binding protein n=1 Tax=Dolosigranulum savutiense TaxID=3110288 RepID=A0AB74U3L9_9LACT
MKKTSKFSLYSFVLIFLSIFVVACSNGESTTDNSTEEAVSEEQKNLVIGATSGPYADMVREGIAPLLEERGYTVEIKEFTDYVQPNNALASGELDANLFQHIIYLEEFSKENNLDLTPLIQVPTAPMGIFSNTYDSLADVEEGAEFSLPGDATNAARAYNILEREGLVKLISDVNPLTTSKQDVEENPYNLSFVEIEAAGLPRAIESSDLTAVPGNFALASGLDLTTALTLENMDDNYRNRVVVRTEDAESQFAKDIIEIIKSEEFDRIIDEKFQGFDKPDYTKE